MKPLYRYLILALLLVGLTWFGRHFLQPVFTPVFGAFSATKRTIVGPFQTLSSISSLAKENKDLKAGNSELKARVARLENVLDSNQETAHQLDALDKIAKDRVLPANVVGYSPSTYQQTLRINAGTSDGISVGQAVLANGHLIGRIHQTTGGWSDVLLLSNHNILIPAKTNHSNQTGLVRGGINGLMIEEVPLEPKLEIGELVVTSGIDDQLPADLPIGEVAVLRSGVGDIFQTARITMPINLNQVQTVLVIYR